MMEHYQFNKFCVMLNWLIGTRTDFEAEREKHAKNINKYLNDDENENLAASFGGGKIENVWQSLFVRCEFFINISHEVAQYFSYTVREKEESIINHIKMMRSGEKYIEE